jgi:hypothetical protein
MMHDIAEYVTDEMFSSPRGLGAFKRILEKSDNLQNQIKNNKSKKTA